MATPVAQVDVRIGETALERYYVRAGEQLQIGSHRVIGDVDGIVVRGARLALGDVVTLQVGLAIFEVRIASLSRVPVPRPRFDVRPAIYTTLSLAAHLSIWWTASRVPLPAAAPRRVRARLVQHPREPPPAPKPTTAAAPSAPREHPARRLTKPVAPIARVAAAVTDAVPKIDWDAAFTGVGEIQHPDDAGGFGHELAPGVQTVPSGPWASVSSADPLVMCVTDCRATGPIDLLKLSDDLDNAWSALTKCDYTRSPVILNFTIDRDGHAGRIDREAGAGADCAAKIIASNQFRKMSDPTDVTLSLGYK
jgi:hypothetical protein